MSRPCAGPAATLDVVDKVRFGRALGYGTRHAAKTLAQAVDAATTPAPAPERRTSGSTPPARSEALRSTPPPTRVSPAARAKTAGTGAKSLSRSLWSPLALFGGALWLRVTGLFFAVMTFSLGAGAWRVWHAQPPAVSLSAQLATVPRGFWLLCAVALLFGWSALSSFMQAARKERRGAGR